MVRRFPIFEALASAILIATLVACVPTQIQPIATKGPAPTVTRPTPSAPVPVVATSTGASPAVISWKLTTVGKCREAAITQDTVEFGDCGGLLSISQIYSQERKSDLNEFENLFSSFSAETPGGTIRFAGSGKVTATPWQQRMIAEWSNLVTQEAEAGRSDASWGQVLAWHREGGIAGFCDDAAIYLSGEALATSCKTEHLSHPARTRMTSNQLRTIYQWYDSLHDFELSQSDLATADSLSTKITFTGAGPADALEADQQQMQELAANIYLQISQKNDPADLHNAQGTLAAYLEALNAGRFGEAAALFAGDIQILRNNNPDISPEDGAGLFQAACEKNGFICDLKLKNEVSAAQISTTEYRVVVELVKPDGSLFSLGPCCGEDPDTPPTTQFEFIVVSIDGRFLVQSLPVYSP